MLEAPTQGVRRVAAVALIAGIVSLNAHAQLACQAGETAATFNFTGGEQTSTVPANATSVRIFLFGAQGADGVSGNGNVAGTGGLGAQVTGTSAVTPGETLSIWVGGQGSTAVNPGGQGGLNSGAGTVRAGNGGGATDVRRGGNAVVNRIAIAAGGGGGGNAGWGGSAAVPGGNGGNSGASGGAGADVASPSSNGPFGGGGGSIGTGGTGGAGCGSFPATAGNTSGDGGATFNFSGGFSGSGAGGGGGGGATVGAGGGGAGVGTTSCQQNWNGGGGGGAGGASNPMALTSASVTNGVRSGDGTALLCYAQAAVVVDPVLPVPTLQQWALWALATLLLIVGLGVVRKRGGH